MLEDLPAWRVMATTVLVNLGLAGMVGAWASLLWLRAAASPWASRARRQSSAALKATLTLTVISAALLLLMQTAYMAEVPWTGALAMLPTVVSTTYVGRAGSAGALGLLLVFAARRGGRGEDRVGLPVAAIGMGVFIGGRAAVSHAGDSGLLSLQFLMECAHLSAISLWLGIVGIAAFGVLNDHVEAHQLERADLGSWLRALSAAATGALIVVTVTGIFNAWRSVGATANLTGSAYGITLVIKVVLVLVAVALGGFNRWHYMPLLLAALRTPLGVPAQPQQRFRQVLCIEAVLLFAALVAAAILSSSPLPQPT
jgi:putative copper resistance protein D